jgi:hypothetical protein
MHKAAHWKNQGVEKGAPYAPARGKPRLSGKPVPAQNSFTAEKQSPLRKGGLE